MNFTLPLNESLVNFANLNWILRSEIFFLQDEQLCAVHVILGFKPISTFFQSPKYVIKAKDSRLAFINVAVHGFFIKLPPSGTQNAQLLALLATKLLYSDEQPLPSNDKREKPSSEPIHEVQDKDFEIFFQEDLEDSQTLARRHLVTA